MADNSAGGKRVAYEGLFILDANRMARDPQGMPREVADLVESHGGEIEVSRLWEERRLAYPIKGQRKGAYWIMYFRMDPTQLAPLTRQCEIKDSILRQLFVRLPEKLVEPIFEHAKGAAAESHSESNEAAQSEESSVKETEQVPAG